MVAAARGPDLLRVKGIVNLAGSPGPVVIHGVQHIFHPPVVLPRWPSEDRSTRVVFIGRNPPEDVLRQAFLICTGQATAEATLRGALAEAAAAEPLPEKVR